LDALDASLGVGVTERPLASFAVPDRFDIDDFFVARHLEERDVQIVTRAFCDPLSDGENRKPFDEALLRTVLREPLSERRARAILVPYVIENTADESLYGGITFRHFDPMRGVIEIGYWLLPHARGRGLATRSVRAAAREAFASGLWRIEANVRIGNGASERVLERVGFTREGLRRRLLRDGGERVDATHFSLLAGE